MEEFGAEESEVAGEGTVTDVTSASALNSLISSASGAVSARLTEDIYGANIEIPVGKTVVLDLNGHTLSNAAQPTTATPEAADTTPGAEQSSVAEAMNHTIINKGILTITDTSSETLGVVDNVTHQHAPLYNDVGGNATILKGQFTRSKEAGASTEDSGGNSWYYIHNNGTMTIGSKSSPNDSDVQIGSEGHFSSLVHNGWFNGKENSTENNASMTIYAGTFQGGINTVKNDDCGELVIYGGSFKNATKYCVQNWNVATINGGTYESTGTYAVFNDFDESAKEFRDAVNYIQGKLTINGGTFKSASSVVTC